MKYIAVLSLFISSLSFAQDKIYRHKGEVLNVKIVKVDSSIVHYKKLKDPTFTTLAMDELHIKKVVYEDGKVIRFNRKPQHFIAFELGSSSPSNDFQSKNLNNAKAGYAESGLSVRLSGAYYFNNHIGIGLQFGVFENPYVNPLLRSRFTELFPSFDSNIAFDLWRNSYGLFSFHYAVRLHHRFTWDNAVYLGRVTTNKPAIYFSALNTSTGASFNYQSSAGEGQRVATGIHSQIKFHFSKHWAFAVGLQTVRTSVLVNYTDTLSFLSQTGDIIVSQEFEGSQVFNISVVNILYQVSYNF